MNGSSVLWMKNASVQNLFVVLIITAPVYLRVGASDKPGAVQIHYAPLRKGEKLLDKVEAQLAEICRLPDLVRSFFRAPSVDYIAGW